MVWTLQFSCTLGGSTSLWPNGSVSILHFLGGLSCVTTTVSLWSSRGSRDPLLSWLNVWTAGWLQPLELLSKIGGGSTLRLQGPLDWAGSSFTCFTEGNVAPSIGWLEMWPAIPDGQIFRVKTKKRFIHSAGKSYKKPCAALEPDRFDCCCPPSLSGLCCCLKC